MSDLNKSVHSREKDPYRAIAIQPLEKDKRQKDEQDSDEHQGKISQTFSMLASCFQKLTGPSESKIRSRTSTPSSSRLQKTQDTLKAFRKLLATLAGEDCSHNSHFNQQLSRLWHNLLDDCNCLPSKEADSLTISSKLKFFIRQIQNFPIGSEHTLGYYFSHNVGDTWIPFPCMKLLQELHEEFVKAPSHSTLHNWILLVDDLILTCAKS